MTTRQLLALESLLAQFRDEYTWDRREQPNGARPEEEAIPKALGVIRATRHGRPLYRRNNAD